MPPNPCAEHRPAGLPTLQHARKTRTQTRFTKWGNAKAPRAGASLRCPAFWGVVGSFPFSRRARRVSLFFRRKAATWFPRSGNTLPAKRQCRHVPLTRAAKKTGRYTGEGGVNSRPTGGGFGLRGGLSAQFSSFHYWDIGLMEGGGGLGIVFALFIRPSS